MKTPLCLLWITLLMMELAWAQKPDSKVFTYQNPISNGITNGIRDAQIYQENGMYYLIGTAPEFWTGPNPGVRIFSSKDLLNWKSDGLLIDRSKLDSSVWYFDRFWAPELQKIKGKYYLTFNCRNEQEKYKHSHGCGVAVADNLMGPYKVVTETKPLTGGNDLTLFEDTNGKVYAFWNGAKKMFVCEINLKNMTLIGEPALIFTPDAGTWDAIGIEGPYCVKRDGQYYLFYSSWSRGYEIGYATASSPLGRWTKYAKNPIYGAQDKNTCEKNNLPFTDNPNGAFKAVGHNEIWKGPDGRLWISCHGILREPNAQPYLVIDPIDFVNGEIKATGPTSTRQTVPLPVVMGNKKAKK